jgi:hypothetical protein
MIRPYWKSESISLYSNHCHSNALSATADSKAIETLAINGGQTTKHPRLADTSGVPNIDETIRGMGAKRRPFAKGAKRNVKDLYDALTQTLLYMSVLYLAC